MYIAIKKSISLVLASYFLNSAPISAQTSEFQNLLSPYGSRFAQPQLGVAPNALIECLFLGQLSPDVSTPNEIDRAWPNVTPELGREQLRKRRGQLLIDRGPWVIEPYGEPKLGDGTPGWMLDNLPIDPGPWVIEPYGEPKLGEKQLGAGNRAAKTPDTETSIDTSHCDLIDPPAIPGKYAPDEPPGLSTPGSTEGCNTCASTGPGHIGEGIGAGEFPELPAQARNDIMQYASSEEGVACQKAYFDSSALDSGFVSPVEKARQKLADYLKSCLTVEVGAKYKIEYSATKDSYNEFISHDLKYGVAIFQDIKKKAYNHIVHFELFGSCHGIITRNLDEKLILITARHCMKEDKERFYVSLPVSFEAKSLAGVSFEVSPCDAGISFESARKAYNDIAVLELCRVLEVESGTSIEPSFEAFEAAATLKRGDQLLFASQIRYLRPDSQHFSDFQANFLSSASMFAVDDKPTCRVFDFSGDVIIHNCQSERGSSGAPIFKLVATAMGFTLQLAGVHTGYAGDLVGYEKAEYARNRGVKLGPI